MMDYAKTGMENYMAGMFGAKWPGRGYSKFENKMMEKQEDELWAALLEMRPGHVHPADGTLEAEVRFLYGIVYDRPYEEDQMSRHYTRAWFIAALLLCGMGGQAEGIVRRIADENRARAAYANGMMDRARMLAREAAGALPA